MADDHTEPRIDAWNRRLDWPLTAFALDYFARIYLARRKWWFVGTDFPDLLILVLPMFRQLRALRLLTVISILDRQLRADFRGRVVIWPASSTPW